MNPQVVPSSIERVDKPWGHELIWAKTKTYVGKVLVIKKGQKLSLQYHREKEETLFLARGKMILVRESFDSNGDSNGDGKLIETTVNPGEAYHVPPGAKHRM